MTSSEWISGLIRRGFRIELTPAEKIVIRPASELTTEDREFIANRRQWIVDALRKLQAQEAESLIWDCDRHQVWDQVAFTRAIRMIATPAKEVRPETSSSRTVSKQLQVLC